MESEPPALDASAFNHPPPLLPSPTDQSPLTGSRGMKTILAASPSGFEAAPGGVVVFLDRPGGLGLKEWKGLLVERRLSEVPISGGLSDVLHLPCTTSLPLPSLKARTLESN